ncbi:MAG TPA: hypothetical protein VFI45_07500 [Candidatus Acidoferrum sp.]|nr:hypothetical protein [Candidatus Acidoferrum sp.]
MTRKVLRDSIFVKALLRSFGLKILVGLVCLLVAVCLHAPVALAQHGGGAHAGGGFGGGHFGGGGGHFGGSGHSGGHPAGGAHASAPRGSAPAPGASSATSGIRTATIAPLQTALPSKTTSFGTGNAGNLRPRPVPRPTPPPVSIIYIPVYYSPFFYGGFNSFWGCDPFWGFGGCYSPFGFGYGGYGGFGYGGYYGGLYNGWGWGSYGLGGYNGAGIGAGSNVYSSTGAGGEVTTPQNYVAPSYPTDIRGRDMVELFFKDGTVFNVIDYWLVDGQLHFLTVDERGEKSVEHVLPFDTLDVQKSTDVNTDRGFKFQLRNESMEQYLRNHPEAEPKVDPDAAHNQ